MTWKSQSESVPRARHGIRIVWLWRCFLRTVSPAFCCHPGAQSLFGLTRPRLLELCRTSCLLVVARPGSNSLCTGEATERGARSGLQVSGDAAVGRGFHAACRTTRKAEGARAPVSLCWQTLSCVMLCVVSAARCVLSCSPVRERLVHMGVNRNRVNDAYAICGDFNTLPSTRPRHLSHRRRVWAARLPSVPGSRPRYSDWAEGVHDLLGARSASAQAWRRPAPLAAIAGSSVCRGERLLYVDSGLAMKRASPTTTRAGVASGFHAVCGFHTDPPAPFPGSEETAPGGAATR